MDKPLSERVLNNIEKYVGRKKGFEKRLKDGLQHIYWGVTIDENVGIKVLFILNRLVEMAQLGNKITILIADIHTLLDRQRLIKKDEIENFKCILNKILDGYNIDKTVRDKFTIVVGSEFQLNKTYILDLYKLLAVNGTVIEYCREFNLDINKIEFKDVLHPILQTLDEAHLMEIANLDVDCQVGYVSCLNQYVFSKKNMKHLGFKSKTYLLYDVPDEILSSVIKVNINYSENILVPIINSLGLHILKFIIKTMFDYALISGIIDNETKESQLSNYDELDTDCKKDTVINIIKNFYIRYLIKSSPS